MVVKCTAVPLALANQLPLLSIAGHKTDSGKQCYSM